ncbi:unnamed protein product [Cunninghamella echinulata]
MVIPNDRYVKSSVGHSSDVSAVENFCGSCDTFCKWGICHFFRIVSKGYGVKGIAKVLATNLVFSASFLVQKVKRVEFIKI